MKKHILTLALYALPLLASAAPTLPSSEKPDITFDPDLRTITGGRLIEQTFNGTDYHVTRYNFDGLGRPYQMIRENASPAGRDVVSFVIYDCMGRPDSVAYLPYTRADAPTYAGSPQEQMAFYRECLGHEPDAEYAFTLRLYDRSPLGLVQTTTSLGAPAGIPTVGGNPTSYTYRLNAFPVTLDLPDPPAPGTPGTTLPPGSFPGGTDFPGTAVQPQKLDSVKRFSVTDAGTLRFEGYYPINTLSVVVTERKTMENTTVQTFDYTDCRGNQIARKAVSDRDTRWSYVVYDQYGRLRYEIPPIMDARFTTPGSSYTITALNPYCTYREYDGRGNCILTRNPGQDAILVVYDKHDRPILTQHGNQRLRNRWVYSKYDDCNRVLETRLVECPLEVSAIRGLFADLAGYDAHRRMLDNTTTVMQLSCSVYGGYDDYDLLSDTSLDHGGAVGSGGAIADVPPPVAPPAVELPVVARRKAYRPFAVPAALAFEPVAEVVSAHDCYADATGLKVYERLAILPDAETDTTAYIERAMYYDREGRMVQSVTRNHLGGLSRLSCRYDYPGNLLVQHEWRQAGADAVPDVKVTRNTFDGYGRFLDSSTQLNDSPEATMHYAYDERAQLRSAAYGAGLLQDTYRYDVAGRLTEQNNGLFTMTLRRDKPLRIASQANYVGQVSECTWQHKNLQSTEQTYAYHYDWQGQFLGAVHLEGNQPTDRYTEKGVSYNPNGNLSTMTRSNGSLPQNVLAYLYSGNRLLSVTDNKAVIRQFTYDQNGNVASERQKGWKYRYNYLNLTERVTDAKLHVLAAYRYLADGTRIGVTNQNGDGYEYLGSLIYRRTPNGLEIESTDFSGGRIDRTTTGYAVKYFVRDYLGSVRAIADERGQRIEAMDYLPFGSRWDDPQRLVTDNRYQYNGKEWQPTGDLNVLDYGARHYDPTLGRWFNPDPMMQELNPYIYCGNNAINHYDPNGLAWRPTYTTDHDGNQSPNGYEWVEDSEAYDQDGVLKPGYYEQAIFFSNTKSLNQGGGAKMGSSTATVYLANGQLVTFDACTVASSTKYPTVPEGRYKALTGIHHGTQSSYPALKMSDLNDPKKIELGFANPAYPERTWAVGIDIHKPGANNLTGITKKGNPISAGCLLIDINRWDEFISIFYAPDQVDNVISVTVSRTLSAPLNANILPAFNFIMSGSRYSFFHNY